MFRRIIVAVDGHDGGLDASVLARTLAPPTAELVAATAVARESGPEGVADAGDHEALTVARRLIEAGPGLSSVGVVVYARSVAAGLNRLAREQSADLLVLGSHHGGGTAGVWSEARPQASLRDASCPVVVAPRGFADGARPIGSIGVAYEESEAAERALDMGRALAWDTGADLQAIEVVPQTSGRTPESSAGPRAVAAGDRLSEIEGVTGVVVEGDLLARLAQFACEVDVLILGSDRHGLLTRLVLRHAPCALLVMPHPPGDTPGY